MADLAERGIPADRSGRGARSTRSSRPRTRPGRDVVETIDIGGVTLLRAAAKNVRDVIVLSTTRAVRRGARRARGAGGLPRALRLTWARAAFARTARYDAAIAAERSRARSSRRRAAAPPATWVRGFERARRLRYGENPHQPAALYAAAGAGAGIVDAVREGKELSYNNLLDLDAAIALVREFAGPACVIVKHNEPCGVGRGARAFEAFERAFEADALSAFGGIVAFNVAVDAETATALAKPFLECVAAPSFAPAALDTLRVEEEPPARARARAASPARWEARALGAGDCSSRARARTRPASSSRWRPGARRTPEEMEALLFAWTVVAARALERDRARARRRTLGVGSGQTSRVDAVDVALMKARRVGPRHAGRGARDRRVLPVRRQRRARRAPRGSRPRSSPAARCATRSRWPRATRRASRWCSPVAGCSGTRGSD